MYELKVEDYNHYLYVTVQCELNPTTDREIDAEIRNLCETRKADLVLIDIQEAPSRLDYMENFSAAKTFRERMGPDIRAIAIVDKIDFADRSKIYQLTATARGARVQFSESSQEADSWLLEFRRTDRGKPGCGDRAPV